MRTAGVVACVVLVAAVAASARSIPGAPNEVLDPWFEQTGDPNVWHISGSTWSVAPNPGNLPGGYFDPGRNPGDVATLRTIVDDWDGLWVDENDRKHIDFSMFAHIVGGGYVKVKFDWWYDEMMPRPSPDPNLAPPADGETGWYVASALGGLPGDFASRPDLILPGEEPGWFTPDGVESWLLNIDEIWDIQPRWVSIEIEAGIDPQAPSGGEALITGIDFEAECIPVPAALPAGLALLALAGGVARWRRG